MNADNNCKSIQERFPSLFGGRLTERQKAEIFDHIEACNECQKVYQEEYTMFAVASWQSSINPISEHPDAEQLNKFTNALQSIELTEREQLAKHIAACSICREVINKIQMLPRDMNQLVSGEKTPFISELHSEVGSFVLEGTKSARWLTARMLMVGIAVAAMLLLIVIWQSYRTLPVVTAEFYETVRSIAQPQEFIIPREPSTLQGKVYIDPEENHTYSLVIRDLSTGAELLTMENYTDFDERGFAHFNVPVKQGNYQLVISDIDNFDTLQVVYPFAVILH